MQGREKSLPSWLSEFSFAKLRQFLFPQKPVVKTYQVIPNFGTSRLPFFNFTNFMKSEWQWRLVLCIKPRVCTHGQKCKCASSLLPFQMAWLVISDIHFLDLIMINPKTNKLPFPKISWHFQKVCLIKKGSFLPTVY